MCERRQYTDQGLLGGEAIGRISEAETFHYPFLAQYTRSYSNGFIVV